jgi:hypothetical protein
MSLRTMIVSAVVLALALAGYMGVAAWTIPAGAACLTLDSWRPWRLRRHWSHSGDPPDAWTSKTTTYFITGVMTDLGLAALAFGAGRIVRVLLG